MRSGGECVEASEGVRKRRRLGGSAPTSVTRRTRVVVHACGVARKSDARRASRVRTSGNTARTPIEVARVASLASAVVEVKQQQFGPFEKIWTARVPFWCWRAFQVIYRRPTNSPPNSRFGSAPTLERGTSGGRRAGTRRRRVFRLLAIHCGERRTRVSEGEEVVSRPTRPREPPAVSRRAHSSRRAVSRARVTPETSAYQPRADDRTPPSRVPASSSL